MLPVATALYAGLLGLILLALSVRVMRLRRRLSVGIGDGGKAELARWIRVQGNFVEYVPLTLLLIGFIEAMAFSPWLVHSLGLALVAGRLAHAFGLSRSSGASLGRVGGMALTWTVLGAAAILTFVSALPRVF